jgi:hypothetical protein
VSLGRILKRKQPSVDQPVTTSSVSRSALFASLLPQPRTIASGYMTEDEAAAYLTARLPSAVSPRTLRRWRKRHGGPTSHAGHSGRPVWYLQIDLDRWLETESVKAA